jgi:hypothetical protein
MTLVKAVISIKARTKYTKSTSGADVIDGAEVMGCGSAPIKGTASDSIWRCQGQYSTSPSPGAQ